MRIRDGIEVDEQRLAELCQRYQVVELALFGSVLRDDFDRDSDIDLLYVFHPEAKVGWREIHDFDRELSELLGRPVDLVPKRWLTPTMAGQVLAEARTLYAA